MSSTVAPHFRGWKVNREKNKGNRKEKKDQASQKAKFSGLQKSRKMGLSNRSACVFKSHVCACPGDGKACGAEGTATFKTLGSASRTSSLTH